MTNSTLLKHFLEKRQSFQLRSWCVFAICSIIATCVDFCYQFHPESDSLNIFLKNKSHVCPGDAKIITNFLGLI